MTSTWELFERDLRAPPGPRWALVVEDDREMSHLLARAVRSGGLPVVCLGHGSQAQALLRSLLARGLGPTMLVTDVRLPGLSGLDLLASAPGVPTVVISAFADDALRAQAFRLGAAAVLDKPFPLSLLRHTLTALRGATLR